MQIRKQRISLWISIFGGLVYSFAYVYMVKFFPPPPPALTAIEVMALYTENTLRFQFGIFIMIVSGAFLLPWYAVIVTQMMRIEEKFQIWCLLVAMTAPIGTLLFAFPPIIWGIAAFTLSRAPELTLLIHEFGWLSFVTPVSFFIFQSLPIGLVSLSEANKDKVSAFPRWVGWLSIWTAFLAFLGGFAIIYRTGPFAWNGVFPFYIPVFIFVIWYIAMTKTMFKALSFQEETENVGG